MVCTRLVVVVVVVALGSFCNLALILAFSLSYYYIHAVYSQYLQVFAESFWSPAASPIQSAKLLWKRDITSRDIPIGLVRDFFRLHSF